MHLLVAVTCRTELGNEKRLLLELLCMLLLAAALATISRPACPTAVLLWPDSLLTHG
jgi:hypothetical protein